MFIEKPILVISNLDKELRVEVNVLNFAIEKVLSIKYENKKV